MKIGIWRVLFLASFSASLIVSGSCGSNTSGFVQSYNAAANIGDLLNVTVDTGALTYSYQFLQGDLAGVKGAGTLTRNDSSAANIFSTSDGFPLVAIQNEVVIGQIGSDFYLGVPTSTSPVSVTDLVGVYNYVRFFPAGTSANPLDTSNFGTLKMNADGTWQVAEQSNLGVKGTPILNGTYNLGSNGIVELFIVVNNGAVKLANLALRTNSSGQHFVVVDFTDTGIAKGIGFGQKQAGTYVASGDVDGNYTAIFGNGSLDQGSVKGTQLNIQAVGNFPSISYTLTYNNPWPGLITGTSIIPGFGKASFTGFYSQGSQSLYGVFTVNATNSLIPPISLPFVAMKN